ncbi:serine O-acetyltransferase [Enterococcus sp. 669A]|uniref:Serine acetyltransferase n=2 Tax=Candidatus Enterococcus moelleringii TaxID=2815325 RepID=A0ABS3LCM7_9ENTE|nr:serine O-acetyltransferase EpsC [Enterococcus sp. 669A]MBO1307388.1 serine O-acetyltransferase [Enterococcus sp. 669A]
MRWLKHALQAAKRNDPAAHSTLEILLTYPGFHALLGHRLSHFLYRHQLFLLAKLHAAWCRFLTGIEIHPGAQISHGVFIDHGMGLVIGETAVIEEDVVLFHGVTLGGTGKDTGKRHPTVRKGAMISAHAQVLGPIVVGAYAKVGASSVVLKEVPAYATVVGIPAAVVRINQPVSQEIKIPVNQKVAEEVLTSCCCR